MKADQELAKIPVSKAGIRNQSVDEINIEM